MAYEIDVYPEADAQRATLPAPALVLYGQVLDVLQLTPWNGRSAQPSNPGGAVRLWAVDRLLVSYVILEDERRVGIISVTWAG
ncbi:MAG TPA: hypothetical protein VF667_06940 [Pseudonocardia sp.]